MSGITALCNLSGGHLPNTDLAALQLDQTPASFAGTVADRSVPSLAGSLSTGTRQTCLLGWPAGAEFSAILADGAGQEDAVSAMRRLLDRYGPALPEMVDGEWLLLDWQSGRLLLAQSRVRRDWLFHARRGDCIAISGDLDRMAALDWIGRDLDPVGLAASFGRAPLRAATTRRTILPGVQRLEPGEVLVLTPGAEHSHRAALPAVAAWRGSFAEAVEAGRDLLHQLLAERLTVAGPAGLLLSGGLDSSTLAVLIRDLTGEERPLPAFTSVAPPGQGMADERSQALAVAERLGLRHVPVVPDGSASAYRPRAEAYAMAGGPTLSPRHYLYRALCEAARAEGVATLFDGAFGEFTLTSYTPLAGPRYRLRQAVRRVIGRGDDPAAGSHFHVRLAPHRLSGLRAEVSDLARGHQLPPSERKTGEAWGWLPGFAKTWQQPTLLDHGIRGDLPFRDPRLLALFAGFPARFLVQDGHNRAVARAMMQGHLPEEIRLRRTTGAFSPDYMDRIRTQAPAVLERFGLFRKAEAGDWVDLNWLEEALQRIAANGTRSIPEAFEVQMTAMAAEFLVWWNRAG